MTTKCYNNIVRKTQTPKGKEDVMKAIIHEIINVNHEILKGSTYQVEDLNTELDRLDREGLAFTVTSALPNVIIEGMEVTITYYI